MDEFCKQRMGTVYPNRKYGISQKGSANIC